VIEVSSRSYYSWYKRLESNSFKTNKILLKIIKDIHNENKRIYGSIKIRKKINYGKNLSVNHKLSVAENILKRDFQWKNLMKKWLAILHMYGLMKGRFM